jgi:hypothetical protein
MAILNEKNGAVSGAIFLARLLNKSSGIALS